MYNPQNPHINMNQDQSIESIPPLKEAQTYNRFRRLRFPSFPVFPLISILLVVVAYIWFISFGLWIRWPGITSDYVQLATAFQHGNLSLEVKPNPSILALRNPYDPGERHNLRYPKDFSLYHGKYYLYFGPVPALFVLIVRLMDSGSIDDQFIVFVFTSGMLVFQSLLIIKLWKQFFKSIPVWIIALCILFCGLTSPIPWILTDARVYEAAGTCGQFFFLAGLYFAITALNRQSISTGRLLIAGASWALAIGSRLTQVVPIGFVILMVVFWIIRAYSRNKLYQKIALSLIVFCLPIALGLVMLGWYNWARFNSVFETGYSYQLAGPFIQKYSHILFSPLYLIPNLYDYLVMRPTISMIFPFFQAVPGHGAAKFSFINLPPIYHEDAIIGVLINTPFVLFAGLPILSILFRTPGGASQVSPDDETYFFKWLIISLAGSFLFGFIPIAIFFFVEIRYMIDSMPSLLLLSTIGYWQGYNFLNHKPVIGKIYIAAGTLLMATSILISILCAISANAAQFQQFNPALWNQFTSFSVR